MQSVNDSMMRKMGRNDHAQKGQMDALGGHLPLAAGRQEERGTHGAYAPQTMDRRLSAL